MSKPHNQTTVLLTIVLTFFCLTKAWSSVDFIKPADSGKKLGTSSLVTSSSYNLTALPNNVVPEPNTLALFGSGLFTMLLTFFRRTYSLTKRTIDIIGSVIALILFSPIFLVTALLIKLTSKGPIFYTQTRVGKDGQNFEIYKFRTMKVDAEQATGPVWAAKNDNRLIPAGKFIRKAHIDEMPQFVNVIMGNMSIIGPRPERPIFVEQFKKEISDYTKRLDVKPGITGLAQVWHHYDETIDDVRKKIKYDILYIKKMCFWTDVRILARTVRVVFTGAGAR